MGKDKNKGKDKSPPARISASELLDRLRSDPSLFILDVRNEEDFNAWRIEDINTPETLNIPYIDFIEAPEESIPKVPKNRQVVALCAKGGASDYVVDMLNKEGRDAVNITGGMKAWGSVYTSKTVWEKGDRKIIQFNRVGKGCLSYMIISGREAAIIDPARHVDQYESLLAEEGLDLKFIFDTHLHADHISGASSLKKSTGADYFLNSEDMEEAKTDYLPLQDGQQFVVGSSFIKIVALSSPGHTPGSISIFFDNSVLFTGDTLFVSSMGRPDLGGQAASWVRDLYRTISGFKKYSDDVIVLPAHTSGHEEYDNDGRVIRTLGEIRKSNPLMNIKDKNEFARLVLNRLPEEPDAYQNVRRTNLGLIKPEEEKMEQWELGKNRCAVEQAGKEA